MSRETQDGAVEAPSEQKSELRNNEVSPPGKGADGSGAHAQPDGRESQATKPAAQPRQQEPTTTTVTTASQDDSRVTSSQEISSPSQLAIELPSLPYNLREHKLSITLYWTAIACECCVIPITFYYGLSNGTDLRAGAMFAIITAVFGFVTGVEYAVRGWRLLQRTAWYRPLNDSPRFWGFDSVHWVLSGPYFVMTAVMIGVSIPEPPKTRGLSIILPIGMIMIGVVMVASGVAHALGWRLAYFRLSSHARGSPCPPLTFCILEDMVAVDGGAGLVYREAALARYNASPRFRRLLVQLLWAWGLTSIGLGAGVIALVFSIPEEIAYGLGWGIPTLWGALGALATILWCQRSVRIERELWNSEKAAVN